jgi:hypothetical protein
VEKAVKGFFCLLLAGALLAACAPSSPTAPAQPSAVTMPTVTLAAPPVPATVTTAPAALPAAPTLLSPTLPPAATAAATVQPKMGWALLSSSNAGPAARYDHTAIVDSEHAQLVVFGGRGAATYGDTWLFDLNKYAWREVTGGGPPARFGHAAVYDAANRRILLVMGQGASFFNDVWAFDLEREKWSQLSENGASDSQPRPRYGQSVVLDSRGRVVISHGFSDQGRFDDTWAFDPHTGQWQNLTPSSGARPLKRCLHELVYDAASDRVFLFGGCSSGFGPCPQGDFWAFDFKLNAWTELKPTGALPTPRSNPSLVLDSAKQRLLLFGGKTESGDSGETWAYDLAANRWTEHKGDGPGARSSHDVSYDLRSNRMILFGGTSPSGQKGDVWEWRP